MNRWLHLAVQLIAFVLLACRAEILVAASPELFSGMCDASAAILLDDGSTMVVADDEVNELYVYDTNRPGPPLQRISLNELLGIDPTVDKYSEIDLEGVAQLGGQYYFISSHGRSNGGALREHRHLLVAVSFVRIENQLQAQVVGRPYHDLAVHISDNAALRALGVVEALKLKKKKAKELAPKDQGLNIEGLSETRDGHTLLIAMRNPRPHDRALVVPLLNPEELVTTSAKPELGPPILLDVRLPASIAGRSPGIRSMTYCADQDCYFILAGPHDGQGPFALFRWSGNATDTPQLDSAATRTITQLSGFSPEALLVDPQQHQLQLLSDDGSIEVAVDSPDECKPGTFQRGRCEAKSLLDGRRKSFRSLVVPLAAGH